MKTLYTNEIASLPPEEAIREEFGNPLNCLICKNILYSGSRSVAISECGHKVHVECAREHLAPSNTLEQERKICDCTNFKLPLYVDPKADFESHKENDEIIFFADGIVTAILTGDLESLKKELDINPTIVNIEYRCPEFDAPVSLILIAANANGDKVQIVETLINKKINTSSIDLHGMCALSYAIGKSNDKIVELLSKHDTKLVVTLLAQIELTPNLPRAIMSSMNNHPNYECYEALSQALTRVAIRKGDLELLNTLILAGINLNPLVNIDNCSHLMRAITVPSNDLNMQIVNSLLVGGANRGTLSDIVSMAIHCHSENVIEDVLNNGVDVHLDIDKITCFGKRNLDLAIERGYLKITRMLIEIGKNNVNTISGNRYTPLMLAAYHKHCDIVRFLVNECKADVNIGRKHDECDDIMTPISFAALAGDLDIVKFLFFKKSDIHRNKIILHCAVRSPTPKTRKDLVDFLMQNGADINAISSTRVTPLHTACHFGHLDMVKLLLKLGLNINASKLDGTIPIHKASEKGHSHLVEYLISNKANVHAVNEKNMNCIHLAAKNGHYEIIKILMENGVNSNLRDFENKTPHCYAVDGGHEMVAKLLDR